MTIQINILNPKAKKLLEDLELLNLISIVPESDIMVKLDVFRKKASKSKLPLESITEEVERVRSKRYAAKKA